LQFAQPILASVFQLLAKNEMNMVEEWVITFGFNKKNPRNLLTPSSQQLHGQPTKVTLPKAKGPKPDSSGCFTSYSMGQHGEDKCGGFHKKKDCPNPPHATTSNLNPN
jgi:hypothetical protein